ncbi:MAG: TonB-dependent receptor [Bacteroidetes bacterium]|nr:TonB-dependent receptor [Bacteroidota bacterium]MBU1580666.1 TonB-dependent receptor [Bacteroidota bacterium]MBU2558027.1 TonB-dependent receptor [Bacteroidota bacterium]
MKKNLLISFLAAMMIFGWQNIYAQGTTTSGMNGRVHDASGETLPGATVVVVDMPTGTQFGTVTDASGYYRIPNMNVGGPYKVTVSFVGFQPYVKDDIFLTLGQTLKLDVKLSESAITLADVEVVASLNDIFDGNRTGAETYVSNAEIGKLPTLSRSIGDFVRLTPQASVSGGTGAITVAGINNRYNAISFDGAVNNDVFGLAASGTNGGQTGGTPISLDAIDQFQIVIAPYDVRQGGFAGASINAVTRRGTNEFEGSAYLLYRNESLAGKTPGEGVEDRTKLDEFTAKTYGMRIGGPIIKNKLFFFLNAEFQRDETPQPFSFADYTGNSTQAELEAFSAKLGTYGYDPGGFLNNTAELNSDKFLARFDLNISQNHKLTLRHSYTKSTSIGPSRSSSRSINYYNRGVFFPSTTNSSALELKSNWNTMSNNLIIGYTTVRDQRDQMGDKFPNLIIYDGAGTINAGSEPYSTGNQLDQDILTINDNFTIYKGAHTVTFGINIEYGKTYNLFMRKAFGEYRFNSLNDFMTGAPAFQYERGYSLVDNIVGDGSAAAADFRTMQYGFYIQDDWQLTDNFKLTAGLRFDVPQYLDTPNAGSNQAVWDDFNNNTIPLIESYGYDLKDAKIGEMPKAYVSVNPRLGFNWDVNGDQTTQVRGGIGLFTSRLPLVWPGGSYTNNGVTVGGVYYRGDVDFRPEWDNQYTATDFGQADAIPSGQVDLFAKDFKNPQVLRTSLGLDHKLPWWGLVGSVEAIYTKNINNVLYYDVNQKPAYGTTVNNGPDQRPYYPGERIEGNYTRIIYGTNTSEGYTYNLTAQVTKPISKGISGTFAYTFGRATSLNDGTSSQNSSQWRYMENVRGLNHLDRSYSDFDLGSRVLAFLSYRLEYANNFATTLSLVYNGQSGQRYSYVYNDRGNMNGEGENAGNLIWIPANESQINLINLVDDDGNVTKTAAQQWADLNSFIESDKYLSENRGDYAVRNGSRLPFESVIDLKLIQDFYINAAGKRHTLQLTLDIFNFTNLLNPEWGIRRYITNDALQLVDYEGTDADGKATFSYSGPADVEEVYNVSDVGIYGSRWTGQIGIRYIFN